MGHFWPLSVSNDEGLLSGVKQPVGSRILEGVHLNGHECLLLPIADIQIVRY
jgi:hypothetical protein